MDSTEWKTIDALVIECAESLFEACGTPLRHAPSHQEGIQRAQTLAVIGFSGQQLRGSVVLSAPDAALFRIFPALIPGRPPGADDLRDWSGELVNQLVGLVKRKLLGFGILIEPSTPTALTGLDVRFGAASSAQCIPHRFEGEGTVLHVRFEAVAAPNVSLTPAPGAPSADEGGSVLF